VNESPRDLRALPKTDLHVHLECSIRPGTLADLADRNGVEIPDGLRAGGFAFRDFAEFIELYVLSCRCLSDLEDFRRIAHEFCQDEAAQGVRWASIGSGSSSYPWRSLPRRTSPPVW
jgi:adenosine deaminase